MDIGSEEDVMGKCNAERISMVGGIRENMDNRVNDGRIMQGARQSKKVRRQSMWRLGIQGRRNDRRDEDSL